MLRDTFRGQVRISFLHPGTAQTLRLALPLLLGVVGLTNCSLLYDLSVSQCQTTNDCRARGAGFEGSVCAASLCITDPDGTDQDSGAGGNAGGPGVECTTNGECIDANFGNPYVCRDGSCLALTTPDQCPIVLGAGQDNENLRKAEPILIGAYSYVDPTAPRLSVPTLNYELAIDEVNEKTRGGLPGGPNGSLRPFVAIVCSGTNSPDLDASLSHLIDDVQVPAVISSLFTSDLLSAFQSHAKAKSVFFLSPLEADSTLTIAEDDGLMWHMLAPARDLSPAYVPLLARTEAHVRALHGLAEADPIRVALLEAKTPFLTDMADDVFATAEFNGESAVTNEAADNLLRLRFDSSFEVVNPDMSPALSALLAFRPHIVIALTSGESVSLIGGLEGGWNPAWGPKPFYLTSPYVFGRSDLTASTLADLRSRLLGVNFAAATETSLYDLYLSKLKSTYDVSFSLEGSENFYDAAYFLMYAIAGSGDPPRLTGREVAVGMTRLLSGKVLFDVGPSDVNDIVGTLRGSSTSKIALQGTMGPPDFNTTTGARRGLPSIYCIDQAGAYLQNAMTYDPVARLLEGSPICIDGFPQ